MDANSHCRLVDDSKLLTKNNLTNNPEITSASPGATPSSWRKAADRDRGAANGHASCGGDTTSPKLAADVQGSNSTSLHTNASQQPLLQAQPRQNN